MKNVFFVVLLTLVVVTSPSPAGAAYKIEVLQAGNNQHFEEAYQGFIRGLEKRGLALGTDVKISRTVIDIKPQAEMYTWENLRVLMRVKITAGEIIERRPDLIVTIGTPATKYSRTKIVNAGIPLLFTCVAEPEVVGCLSKTQAGPGFTGVTTYADPKDIISTSLKGLPNMKKIGVIHSDDDFAAFYADEVKSRAKELGMEAVTRQVNLWDRIAPVVDELAAQDIDALFIPVDRYYLVKNSENAKILSKISFERKIPCISSMSRSIRGPLFYTSTNYDDIGSLTADQAVQVLEKGMRPEDIPVARLDAIHIIPDAEVFKKLGIAVPDQLFSKSPKPVNGHS